MPVREVLYFSNMFPSMYLIFTVNSYKILVKKFSQIILENKYVHMFWCLFVISILK